MHLRSHHVPVNGSILLFYRSCWVLASLGPDYRSCSHNMLAVKRLRSSNDWMCEFFASESVYLPWFSPLKPLVSMQVCAHSVTHVSMFDVHNQWQNRESFHTRYNRVFTYRYEVNCHEINGHSLVCPLSAVICHSCLTNWHIYFKMYMVLHTKDEKSQIWNTFY